MMSGRHRPCHHDLVSPLTRVVLPPRFLFILVAFAVLLQFLFPIGPFDVLDTPTGLSITYIGKTQTNG